MILDYIRIAVINISKRRLRTFLTILGIIIALTAIVSLLLLSNGLENAIKAEFEKIGSNRIFLTSEGGLESNLAISDLTERDIRVVERVAGINEIVRMLVSNEEIEFRNEKNVIPVRGMEFENWESLFVDSYGIELIDGQYIDNKDNFKVLLGWTTANTAFNKPINVGQSIEILGHKFKVEGVFERLGADADDKVVYMPMDTLRMIIDEPEKISMADIIVSEGSDVNKLADRIEFKLERHRGRKDFSLLTPDQLLEQTNNVLGIIEVVIVGIAIISLFVGSVGITNSMYTSVSERRNEIGTMKSLGARNSDILQIFLIESIVIGFFGGIIGTSIGVGIALGIEYIVAQVSPIPLVIYLDPNLIIGAVAFAMIFGIVSGLSPAYQAAKLRPVEALKK